MNVVLRVMLCILLFAPLLSHAETYTIFHTNDEHSRFLGFAPDSEYNPHIRGDGTIGGVARLATLLNEKRNLASQKGPVLTLEAGDFSMGTLFQMISREKGAEIQFLKLLAYDAFTFGNHEFDFGVKGITNMIRSAIREAGRLPPIIASNMNFTKNDAADKGLRDLAQEGVISPYAVIHKGNIKFGILGILGKDAVEVTINYHPLTFTDHIESMKKWVEVLRKQEKVDVIIVLSHSGVDRKDVNWKGTEVLDVGDDGKWMGEDVELAKAVPDIDVIVSGHTHTPLVKPLKVGKTTIVQAGSEMRYLGELQLDYDKHESKILSYELHPIDDKIIGDAEITKKVDALKKEIDESVLKPFHVRFDEATAKIQSNATREYYDNSLGHLLSAAFQEATHADIGFCPDGVIRDDMFHGKSGIQSFSDVFRLLPLGMGEVDEDVGYPMIKVFVNGKELKQILETLILAYKLKGSNYHPRLSGIEFTYNPYRIPLDRVSEAFLKGSDGKKIPIDFKDEQKLYSFGTISYVGKFFWVIPEVSKGLFNVLPKSEKGTPLKEIKDAVITLPDHLGVSREYKGWKALLDYIHTLSLDPESKLPLIPTSGEILMPPMKEDASLSPLSLFKNATWIQWTGYSVALALVLLLVLMARLFIRSKTVQLT